jgi:uncharacterized protein YneF (UPF0154 family)
MINTCCHAKLPRSTTILSYFRDDERMISEQINKNPSISERKHDRFSAQNGKDNSSPRAAKAWQGKKIKENNV